MTKYQNCFLCQISDNLEIIFNVKDIYRKTSKEEFSYYNCKKCDHIFLKDVPIDLGKYYTDKYYDFLSHENFLKIASKEKFKFNNIKRYFSKGDKICEIGPSVGFFLYNAQQYGLKCTGVEMSKECCDYMSKNFGINVINSNKPEEAISKIEKQKGFFFWHSLEHIENPREVIDTCIKKLEDEGLLIIACPNPDSLGFKLLGKAWPHIDAPRHINLFSFQTLEKYMKKKKLAKIFLTTKDRSSKYYNSFSWQLFFFNFFNKNQSFDFKKKKY